MTDIYDYKQRIARSKRVIKQLPNGQAALNFITHLEALGLALAGISKYASHLPSLLRVIDFDVKTLHREDAECVVAYINDQPYRESTKYGKKLVFRRFIQHAKCGKCDKDTPLPKEVRWIKLRMNDKDTRATPESLLTPQDFTAIVQATENTRDRALIYVLFEGALRPGELLTMTLSSIVFKTDHCLITVNGKTGIKRIPLIVAYQPLLLWVADHPQRANPQAPLWCSLANNHKGERLSYTHFRLIIKKLAKKANLQKDIWPYLYRHTTLTTMAKIFTESRLEQFAGWVHGSKMTRRYVHFSARDLEDAMLELHGLKTPEKNEGLTKLIECPRCKNKNPFANLRCNTCAMILDKKVALQIEEKENEKDQELQKQNKELQTRLEKLEVVISSLLTSQMEANRAH